LITVAAGTLLVIPFFKSSSVPILIWLIESNVSQIKRTTETPVTQAADLCQKNNISPY
jgi:hypothetical protein